MKTLIALMLGFVALNASADGVDIKILNPWVLAAPPGVKTLAAYLEIKNYGGNPRILTNVSSPAFDQVGIHRSVMHGNMVHMEQLKELTIPPHASVVLKPGGLHFMLENAKKPLQIGDQVPMTLTFQSGEKIEVKAIIRAGQMEGMEDHQHMNHSGH
ncbi:MAG: copper chaperone PCu(A)C [Gallionella sp.]|nr:copper chaperone PCu(A)C [Gallionella sp.]